MGRVVNYRGLRHELTVVVVVLGLLSGLLAVTASGAFAQTAASDEPEAQAATPDGPEQVYALTPDDELLSFDGDRPDQAESMDITGLVGGESLVGIDFRPANDLLYGLGDQGFIYTIEPNTAVATRGTQLNQMGTPVQLRGDKFGIDFNPVVDRLRVVSDADQNLRVNIDTGATTVDPDLSYANGSDPVVVGAAYRNSQPDAAATELYYIDASKDTVAETADPNAGVLTTVGKLGLNTNKLVGYDIETVGTSPADDRGFAALQDKRSGTSKFYKVNLETGKAKLVGRIGERGTDVEGLAIPIGQE